ncbi:hypothetical protein TrLO_g1657 [Triparma laevis f. longispina]|uniref:Battenin n=1 Tax=Triparma laevis f. longispina TaxID=1714387 RepID=A0A9W7E676_9STRA|nr:hypothetical protein TrLO_g1657 [Triparma laevis f. longispina]
MLSSLTLPTSQLTPSFFLLGLLNNSSYVIMIAGAKEISEGGVALVFLSNVLPSFLCKLSGPFWFHRVPYSIRMYICMVFMSVSFAVVGFANDYRIKLVGVCAASLQSGLGEASLLAMASKYATPSYCLTAWSSGTGAAGVFGFLFVYIFNNLLNLSFTVTLLIANLLTISFGVVFFVMLPEPDGKLEDENENDNTTDEDGLLEDFPRKEISTEGKKGRRMLSMYDRVAFTKKLYKYMLPLFLVYFAEYAMQSGTWAAIGFPVEDEDARKSFYQSANWVYQAGVFVSRSSGNIWHASMFSLWLMPVIQCCMLVLFYLIAVYQFLYSNVLLLGCFFVGLLGGAVYVNAFNRISKDVEKENVELALSTASVADSCGIMLSDVVGLFLQACVYKKFGIDGAAVSC